MYLPQAIVPFEKKLDLFLFNLHVTIQENNCICVLMNLALFTFLSGYLILWHNVNISLWQFSIGQASVVLLVIKCQTVGKVSSLRAQNP